LKKKASDFNKDRKSQEKALVKAQEKKLGHAEKMKRALKVRFALEQEPKVDMYYYRIYRKLRLVRYLCVLVAALFVMSVPMVYSDQITTENFKYLMKYIDLQLSEDSEVYTPLTYESSPHMQFGVYAEDIVLCTDTALVYFDKLGNEIMRESFGPFTNPQLVISDKYVLVYDRGGTEYAIYNNFKRLHHVTTEYPITLCSLSDAGDYAVLTTNQNYISELLIFNHNFKQTGRIQRDLYFSSLFFLEDGSGRFGYTGFSTDTKGGKIGETCLYEKDCTKIFSVSVSDIPLAASVSDGLMRVLYEDRIVWYDEKSVETESYKFESVPYAFVFSPANTALYFGSKDDNDSGHTRFFGGTSKENGVVVKNQEKVRRIQWYDGYYYLLSDESVCRVDHNGKMQNLAIEKGLQELVFLPNGEIMGCYADRTELLKWQ